MKLFIIYIILNIYLIREQSAAGADKRYYKIQTEDKFITSLEGLKIKLTRYAQYNKTNGEKALYKCMKIYNPKFSKIEAEYKVDLGKCVNSRTKTDQQIQLCIENIRKSRLEEANKVYTTGISCIKNA